MGAGGGPVTLAQAAEGEELGEGLRFAAGLHQRRRQLPPRPHLRCAAPETSHGGIFQRYTKRIFQVILARPPVELSPPGPAGMGGEWGAERGGVTFALPARDGGAGPDPGPALRQRRLQRRRRRALRLRRHRGEREHEQQGQGARHLYTWRAAVTELYEG